VSTHLFLDRTHLFLDLFGKSSVTNRPASHDVSTPLLLDQASQDDRIAVVRIDLEHLLNLLERQQKVIVLQLESCVSKSRPIDLRRIAALSLLSSAFRPVNTPAARSTWMGSIGQIFAAYAESSPEFFC
jgi:hypothetical protein